MIIGITISFAGNPRIKAKRITPSIPRSFAKGSKKPEQRASSVMPPKDRFAISHIASPAGAATTTALPSTNKVLSKMDLMKILPICGLRYGGSSKVNEDGIPFRIVFDKIFETAKVIRTPRIITNVSKNEKKTDLNGTET